ncbi:MAG TPA: hypothetical protein VNQ80_09300 [Parapedobacter sp.]|uniref:hypothetical protein n=1 Tax=Parapedobacter sp. TaxID=1958893 RepID=UPI002CD12C74|nr:hypothetical protein [Parapedobacter sp.]HWK57522.1 hypothetical protein [Parapedobacter sp.]
MLKRDQNNEVIAPKHEAYTYIERKLGQLGWTEQEFLKKKIISQSELSKLKNDDREGLTSKKFYKLYTGFSDTAVNAASIIYPDLDLTLGEYTLPKRNEFGNFMAQFEQKSVNTPEEVAAKTGIPLSRIKLIYFRTGSPEAYELLLIEKAIGKEPGSLFEGYYGRKN